ncbi:MAG: biotin/lipoyl-binding protein, partial [Tepidisphaeraceae bacterium]
MMATLGRRRRAQSSARWLLGAAVVLTLVVAVGYAVLAFVRPVVNVTEAVEGPVVQAFYSTGTVSPDREFPIKSNVAGTVTQMLVDKGDRVTKGQELAFVAEPELQLTLKKAQAELSEKQQLAEPKTSPILLELDARTSAAKDMLAIAK